MTETSRRTVLRAGALAAAATPLVAPLVAADPAAAANGAGPAGAGRASSARRLYLRSRFTPLVGAAFTVVEPSRTWRMRLTEVSDLSPSRPGDERGFTLTFTSRGPGPGQGTFLIRRTGFPSTTLFLVPSDHGRRSYHAVVDSL